MATFRKSFDGSVRIFRTQMQSTKIFTIVEIRTATDEFGNSEEQSLFHDRAECCDHDSALSTVLEATYPEDNFFVEIASVAGPKIVYWRVYTLVEI